MAEVLENEVTNAVELTDEVEVKKSGKGRKSLPAVPEGGFPSPIEIDPMLNSVGNDKWGSESFQNLRDYWYTVESYERRLAVTRRDDLLAKAEELFNKHIEQAEGAKKQALIADSIPQSVQAAVSKAATGFDSMISGATSIMLDATLSQEEKLSSLKALVGEGREAFVGPLMAMIQATLGK